MLSSARSHDVEPSPGALVMSRGRAWSQHDGRPPPVVACVAGAEVRGLIDRAAAGACRVQHCTRVDELVGVGASDGAAALIWEVRSRVDALEGASSDELRSLARDRRLLVVYDLPELGARVARSLVAVLPGASLSMRGHDEQLDDIEAFRAGAGAHGAHSRLLGLVPPMVSDVVDDVVTAAVLAGHRRTSSAALARMCGAAVRTLEWRLRSSDVVAPRPLLGSMLSLHSVWRLDMLGWSPKRTALRSGFGSVAAWSNCLARHAGARPSELRTVGFAALSTRLLARIRRAGPASRATSARICDCASPSLETSSCCV